MKQLHRACAAGDVPEGGVCSVRVGDEQIAVVRSEGRLYAIRDVCSHAEVPLSLGDVSGSTIECWLHGSRFDLRTGRPIGLPAKRCVPVYPVEIKDGDVYVAC